MVGIVICILLLGFLEPLCRMFETTDNIFPYAKNYSWIITLGFPIVVFSFGISISYWICCFPWL